MRKKLCLTHINLLYIFIDDEIIIYGTSDTPPDHVIYIIIMGKFITYNDKLGYEMSDVSAVVVAGMVLLAVVLTASVPTAAHPPEEAWNDGPHCHTQIVGPLDVVVTIVGMILGIPFLLTITPIDMECHGGGPVEA